MAFATRCSDGFSGTGLTVGQTLDNAGGGSASVQWVQSTAGGTSAHAEAAGVNANTSGYIQLAINDTPVLAQRTSVKLISNGVGSPYPVVQVRWSSGSGDGYRYAAYFGGSGGFGQPIFLQRCVNGSGTDILNTGVSASSGDVLALEIDATNHITVYINGSSVATFDDSANSSVPAGTGGFGNIGTFDDFKWEIDAGGGGAIAADLTGVATISASLAGLGALAVTMLGVASIAAALTGVGALADVMVGAATLSAALTGVGALAVALTGVATLSGTLTQPSGAAQATLLGAAALTAALTGQGALAVALTGVATLSATARGTGALASVQTGIASLVATLTPPGALFATLLGSATMTATLRGSGRLQVVLVGAAAFTAIPSLPGVLACSMLGIASIVAGLTGNGWNPIARGSSTWITVNDDAAGWTRIT